MHASRFSISCLLLPPYPYYHYSEWFRVYCGSRLVFVDFITFFSLCSLGEQYFTVEEYEVFGLAS